MTHSQIRRRVGKRQLEHEPYIIWNECVDLLATSSYNSLSETQRIAYLVFWYDAEVQNGGHLQYFENQSTSRLGETISALNKLGAICQSVVLTQAEEHYRFRAYKKPQSAEEFVELAQKGEFGEYDRAFHACQPAITELLQAFLQAYEAEFIERVK